MEGNCASNNDTHCGLNRHNITVSVLPPIIIIELVLGLPANVIALYVFCHRYRFWKPTIMFLFNLVLADFLLLVSLPFQIHSLLHHEKWVFGDAWCRINLFMIAVNRSASISFMTAVAVDRYFKVVHPLHKVNLMSSRQVGMIICVIWTVVILLRVPLLTENLLVEYKAQNVCWCRSFHPYENTPPGIKVHYIVYISEFFFPLMLLLFCSVRIYCILRHRQMSKKKNLQAMRIVLVIVGVFITCFCPGAVAGLSALYLKTLGPEYCKGFRLNGEVFVVFVGFTYLNSVLDPVIYCFSGSLFRETLRSSIKWFGPKVVSIRRSETDNKTRKSLTFSTCG